MSYCSVTDVAGDFKGITFGPAFIVTDTTVAKFITEAGALIDSYVGNKYVTPISGDVSALALLSLYCRTLVADRVRSIIEAKQSTNSDMNQNVKSDRFTTANVLKALQEIKNGDSNLSGATLINASASFYSNNNANNQQPRFKKNRRQW